MLLSAFGTLWAAGEEHLLMGNGLRAASCSLGKGCGVPRKLGQPRHQLRILRSVSDHGLLKNLLLLLFFFS